jgi:hypothetical protein
MFLEWSWWTCRSHGCDEGQRSWVTCRFLASAIEEWIEWFTKIVKGCWEQGAGQSQQWSSLGCVCCACDVCKAWRWQCLVGKWMWI